MLNSIFEISILEPHQHLARRTELPISTPTAATLPEVSGATSVCWFAARLPVPSKYCGSCRVIAADELTWTTFGVGLAVAVAFDCPAELLQATSTNPADADRKNVTANLKTRERLICSISFSSCSPGDDQFLSLDLVLILYCRSKRRAGEYS